MELVRSADGAMDSTHSLDPADEDGVQAWVDASAARHGGIDVVYNDAGATRFSPVAQTSSADWSFVLRHELDIVFLASGHAWPHPVARGGGSVLLVGSTAGITGSLTNPRIALTRPARRPGRGGGPHPHRRQRRRRCRRRKRSRPSTTVTRSTAGNGVSTRCPQCVTEICASASRRSVLVVVCSGFSLTKSTTSKASAASGVAMRNSSAVASP